MTTIGRFSAEYTAHGEPVYVRVVAVSRHDRQRRYFLVDSDSYRVGDHAPVADCRPLGMVESGPGGWTVIDSTGLTSDEDFEGTYPNLNDAIEYLADQAARMVVVRVVLGQIRVHTPEQQQAYERHLAQLWPEMVVAR